MRTTRFGNGAEKVRKITVTKPDAMAARKKNMEENEPLDDLDGAQLLARTGAQAGAGIAAPDEARSGHCGAAGRRGPAQQRHRSSFVAVSME